MKLTSITLFITLFVPSLIVAQCCEDASVLGVGTSADTFATQVLQENEVMWSKRVWRIVDMRESSNKMLLNPRISKEINLMNFVRNSVFLNYMNAYSDDDFKQKLNAQQIRKAFTKYDSSNVGGKLKVDSSALNMNSIKRFLIKEDYYFNKRNSSMQVKILGLAPLVDEFDSAGMYLGERQLFWLYYPSIRCCLNQRKIRLNNDSIVYLESFFSKRLFSSEVYFVSVIQHENLPKKRKRENNKLEMDNRRDKIRNGENDYWEH
ncbi:MAG: gliding motility protein GldN [Flavobacteriales bacterium]